MKFTEITVDQIKSYARVEHDEEDDLFQTILEGAKSHIRNYTGLKNEKLDELPDTTIALYVISTEMYENRTGTRFDGKSGKMNELLDRILGTHSFNLL